MGLRNKIESVWEWIKRQATSEVCPMLAGTMIFGLLGAITGNALFLALALFTAYRLGRSEGKSEVICECGESLDDSYENSRDYTENRVSTIDLLRSKEK
jgi:hypothetical protein